MDKESRYIIRKLVLDAICLFIVAFPILLFKLFGVPFHRGFFCNDESISHPYRDGTITSLALYFVGFGIPIPIMLCTEYWQIHKRQERKEAKVIVGRTIPLWFWECYKIIGIFCFGAACSQLTTDIAKYAIGRLRPHFLDVCKPNIDCTLPQNWYRYIEDFVCQGTNDNRIREARLSFLSGHSSFSAYTMVFLAFYIQSRWTWRGSKLVRHLAQFAALSLAWYTALTRVSDYKHHWSDVLAGSVQGTLVAVLIVMYVSKLFPKKKFDPSIYNTSAMSGVSQEQKISMEIADP